MSSNKAAKGAGGKAKSAKGPSEDKREDVLQAVVVADSFQSRFSPFSLEKPRYTLEFLAMNGVQEVFIYAQSHQEQIESYVRQSKWTPISRACPFSSLEFIKVANARSVGDFLRDLDKRNIIEGDFILVHGDVVSNISLDQALASHRARKEANRDSIMTLVLREGGDDEHRTQVKGITPVFVVDPRAKRCLHYEEINPFQSEHYIGLDPDLLKTPELDIRTDLIDAQIDICTPDVLAQWSESFDYELPRAHFLHGVLKDFELNGKLIHTEIVQDGYSARATNLQLLDAISRDVVGGWAFPFAPDANLIKGQTYQLFDDNVYREDGVILGADCEITKSVIGKDTHVSPGSSIRNSTLGRNCRIGANVKIMDSFIWDDVTIDDGAVIEHAIISEFAVVGKKSQIGPGSLLGSGVRVSDKIDLPPATVLSVISADETSVPSDTNLLGPEGKGAIFDDPELDELETNDPYRLQKSLIYSLQDYELALSEDSTLSSEDEFDELSDDELHTSHAASKNDSRSRLNSFASDDSATRNFSNFLYDAIHGLLDVLRGSSGDFDSEKLEFMSLRLANNASDDAVRRAVATAFVRRAVELLNLESGGFDPKKAAKTVLTERKGAKTFIADVGVGNGSIPEQIEFALAVQKACSSSSKVVDVTKAGNLCAAMFQHLYDEEILEEDGILGWWQDSRTKDGSSMEAIREKCKVLVDWLEEADEEDSDEEGSDEDSDDE